MDEFIARANVKHYKSMLETETDPLKRKIIQRLLADEEENRRCSKNGRKSFMLRTALENDR